jgi:hypothetical protein
MIQLHKYLLSSSYVLGSVLGAGETEMSKTWSHIKAFASSESDSYGTYVNPHNRA